MPLKQRIQTENYLGDGFESPERKWRKIAGEKNFGFKKIKDRYRFAQLQVRTINFAQSDGSSYQINFWTSLSLQNWIMIKIIRFELNIFSLVNLTHYFIWRNTMQHFKDILIIYVLIASTNFY